MTIIVIGAELNGQPLVAGDEIGVFDIKLNGEEFCVGSSVLNQPVSPDNFVEIICSMNDGLNSTNPNGFTSGHDFICRFWNNTTAQEIDPTSFTFPYPGYDEHFIALGTAIVEISAEQQNLEAHFIILNNGWTGISSYLIPENNQMSQIVEPISNDLIIIRNFEGQSYQPSGTNTLPNWDYTDGFFVKTSAVTILPFFGYQPQVTEISLAQGWNLLPVLSFTNVNIADLFVGQLSKVEMIKEAIGLKIYWPSKAIQNLYFFEPGKAYLIKMNSPGMITFP